MTIDDLNSIPSTPDRDDPADSDASSGPTIETKVTRRAVIGGLAAAISSPAFAVDEGDIDLAWNEDRSALGLKLGAWREWSLVRAAFADDAEIRWQASRNKLQILVDPVRFAGVPAFPMHLRFERQPSASGLRWQFSVAIGLLSRQTSKPVFLSDFLAKELQPPVGIFNIGETRPDAKDLPQLALSQRDGQALLDRLLGKNSVSCDAPARLSLLPNLSWLLHHADLSTQQPLVALGIAKLTATSLRFGRATPDRGPCRHRAEDILEPRADSLAVAFHGAAPHQMPIVIGKKGKARGELVLDSTAMAAFERWPLPKPHEGRPAGPRREVLLIAGTGKFSVRHGQGNNAHIDGPFSFGFGEMWWARLGTAPWDVASALHFPDSAEISVRLA